MFYEEHSSPPPGPPPVPPSHPPSDDEILHVFDPFTTLEQFTDYFRKEKIPLRRQRELLEKHVPRMWDLALAQSLSKHKREIVKLLEECDSSASLPPQTRPDSGHTSTPSPSQNALPAPPIRTFCLTPQGRKVSAKSWGLFLDGLCDDNRIAPSEVAGYRILLGLKGGGLESPLHFNGTQQQLMVLFAGLCGTLRYDMPAGHDFAAGRYDSVPLIACTPEAEPDDRLHNPYCKYLAAALLDRGNRPLTARKLISAHHMIGHPEKGIKPALIVPTLCRLQALGALRRA